MKSNTNLACSVHISCASPEHFEATVFLLNKDEFHHFILLIYKANMYSIYTNTLNLVIQIKADFFWFTLLILASNII